MIPTQMLRVVSVVRHVLIVSPKHQPQFCVCHVDVVIVLMKVRLASVDVLQNVTPFVIVVVWLTLLIQVCIYLLMIEFIIPLVPSITRITALSQQRVYQENCYFWINRLKTSLNWSWRMMLYGTSPRWWINVPLFKIH